MNLLSQIQSDAADNSVPVSSLLRKCKMFAAEHALDDFAPWVAFELKGYPNAAVLPEYRWLHGTKYRGIFLSSSPQAINPLRIPDSAVSDALGSEFGLKSALLDGVAYFEKLLHNPDFLYFDLDFTAEQVSAVTDKHPELYPELTCKHIWRIMSREDVAALLENVREQVIDKIIEIKKQNPHICQTAAIINNFHDQVTNVAIESTGFSQQAK